MARGVNKAIIVGNCCASPEMRYLPSGIAVVSVSVATNEEWDDKNTGQKQTRTEYHRVEAFGKLAEIMGQYLKKGSQVYIEGSIRTDKWTDQQGVEKYSTKIRAEQMQMLGNKSDNGGQTTAGDYKKGKETPQSQQFKAPEIDDNFEDDIPF